MKPNRRRTRTRNQFRQKLWEQKVMGIILLVFSAVLLWMCGSANEDCTAVLIFGAPGLVLLFSRKIWIA